MVSPNVIPDWTLYTIYQTEGSRGTENERQEHGYKVHRYGGDRLYDLEETEDLQGNVPDSFDNILTRDNPSGKFDSIWTFW